MARDGHEDRGSHVRRLEIEHSHKETGHDAEIVGSESPRPAEGMEDGQIDSPKAPGGR